MNHTEILAELPKLSPNERREILERLGELQDQDLCTQQGVADWEKPLLDKAAADYSRNGDVAIPWRAAIAQVQATSPK